MVKRPETRFAWNGGVALAYQVIGNGPLDIVYLQGYCSNVDVNWESPHLARFLDGLAGFGRLIVMDWRGWGCSDRFSPTDVPPFETLTDDLQAVMDAAGSERAAIFTSYENASLVMLFAASHSERCTALVLVDPWITWMATEETPWVQTEEGWVGINAQLRDKWGTDCWAPMKDAAEQDWYVRYQRASITPGSAFAEFSAYKRTDVRAILVERHHATVCSLLARYRGVEVDTAGDGFFATFDGPARAASCAGAIVTAMQPLEIEVRAGLHTGEVETIAGKAGGMAVVIGARVGGRAGPSEVLATRTVKDLTMGSGLVFEDAGEAELKGVPERWQLYRVTGSGPPA